MRRVVAVIVVVVLFAAGLVLLMGDRLTSRFTAAGRRDRMLRRLTSTEILVRRSCGPGEAYVDAARWNQLSSADRQLAADALASYCAAQDGATTVTVYDASSRETLARGTGTAPDREDR
jgi:hypothetical protein